MDSVSWVHFQFVKQKGVSICHAKRGFSLSSKKGFQFVKQKREIVISVCQAKRENVVSVCQAKRIGSSNRKVNTHVSHIISGSCQWYGTSLPAGSRWSSVPCTMCTCQDGTVDCYVPKCPDIQCNKVGSMLLLF